MPPLVTPFYSHGNPMLEMGWEPDQVQMLQPPPQPTAVTALSSHTVMHCALQPLDLCREHPARLHKAACCPSECNHRVKWTHSFRLGYQACTLVASFISQILLDLIM